MLYQKSRSLLLTAMSFAATISYGNDKLMAPLAPYVNKSKSIHRQMPAFKEVPTVTTHWKNKVNYKKAGFYIANKSLNVKEKLKRLELESDKKLYIVINNRIMATFQMTGVTKGGSGYPFKMVKGSKPQLKVDRETGLITWRKQFYLNKAKTETAYFNYTAVLQGNGLIKVTWEAEVSDEQWKKYRKDYALFIYLTDFLEQKITINGEKCSFIPEEEIKKQITHKVWSGTFDKFEFNADDPGNGFTLLFLDNPSGYISEGLNWNKKRSKLCIRVNPAHHSKKISILVDIGMITSSMEKSSDIHAGIDFWKSDRLHVPDYSKSINLIQNPSFEEGLRYYNLFSTWSKPARRTKPVYEISEKVAKFGKCSLQINVAPKEKIGHVQTFAIPVTKGEKYTLSFYARANKPAWIDVRCVTGVWKQFPKLNGDTVNAEWRRYVSTFTAPNNAVTILLGGVYHGVDQDGAQIFIDGVQLEKGTKASPFVDQTVCARLLTSDKDNFLSELQPVNASLEIVGPENMKGEAKLKLKDFFYSEPWRGEYEFTTDADGQAIIKLPLNDFVKNGIYILRGDITFADGSSLTDFFRIARMKPLKNEHRNKDIFGSNIQTRHVRTKDVLQRCKQIGFGSANYHKDKLSHELFAEYGITLTGINAATYDYKRLRKGKKIVQLKSFKDKSKVFVDDLTTPTTVTPEFEQQIEEGAYQMAKEHPSINDWFLAGECDCNRFNILREKNWNGFGRMLVAFYKGIKKFDPNKKVYITGGPSNMYPQSGIRFLENIIKGVDGKVKFDGVAIHPYRTKPNSPDLDDDTAQFIAMLERNGYKNTSVYWNEGIYHTYYNIPAWGLNPYRGCSSDQYHAYCPSYDMGWGERISAAYYARSWLVALKYQDYVKQFNGWSSWLFMDAYLTPLAIQKIPNTLGNILGNAYFKKDIRFAPKVRCYVFEDSKKRPVAALWSQFDKVDSGLKQAPSVAFSFDSSLETIYDLMENKHTVSDKNGEVTIPVSPFPVFLVGKADSLEKFCAALQKGKILDSEELPIIISGAPISVNQAQITCKNQLTAPFKGQLLINGKSQQLSLDSTASKKIMVNLPKSLQFNKITAFNIPVKLILDNKQKISETIEFKAFAIHKNVGKLDWNKIPAIKLTNRKVVRFTGFTTRKPVVYKKKVGVKGDFEAEFKAAWDDKFFYLKVAVVDDDLVTIPKGKIGAGWRFDSLQLYFDTFCDAKTNSFKGFDSNDYGYDIVPVATDKAIVYRRNAPEQQIAGGLNAPRPNTIEPEVKCSFSKTSGGYVYELAFPRRLLAPMLFEKNAKIGFGIYLNDNDGEGLRSSLTITPPETGCYMQPHLYPTMLLTD